MRSGLCLYRGHASLGLNEAGIDTQADQILGGMDSPDGHLGRQDSLVTLPSLP